MARIRWRASLGSQDIEPMVETAENSIAVIQAAVGPLAPYSANGAMQAVTTLSWPPAQPAAFATTEQAHSEMVALAATFAPPPIWQLDATGHVVSINGLGIGGANYFTNLPHCGYCTIMLWVLGLPIGVATRGRYNFAVNLAYTVPPAVFQDLNVLSRLVNSNTAGNAGWVVIKNMVNAFIQNDSASWVLQVGAQFVTDTAVIAHAGVATVLDWTTEAKDHRVDVNVSHYGQNTLLTTLWKFVYQGIYENVV